METSKLSCIVTKKKKIIYQNEISQKAGSNDSKRAEREAFEEVSVIIANNIFEYINN